ncbi:class F sortase [Microcella putealis]|uniref:class F sortase n=1 Tax=Microcella putealis TaxID=337005 RepID=UPI001F5453C3|nr:class F sortase [Microcella putealis]
MVGTAGHSTRARTRGGLALVAASVVWVMVGCASPPIAGDSVAGPVASTAPTRAAEAPTPAPPRERSEPLEVAIPVALTIPRIGVDRPLIDLGIAADGSLEVPTNFDDIGWFSGGGRPGAAGPTVIAAHVDSPTGPAAFIRLDELAVGDLVEVTTSDGDGHVYRVTDRAQYPKDAFPTAAVFAASADDVLRLITCDGAFDRDRGSYLDNLVVTAEPVEG